MEVPEEVEAAEEVGVAEEPQSIPIEEDELEELCGVLELAELEVKMTGVEEL